MVNGRIIIPIQMFILIKFCTKLNKTIKCGKVKILFVENRTTIGSSSNEVFHWSDEFIKRTSATSWQLFKK